MTVDDPSFPVAPAGGATDEIVPVRFMFTPVEFVGVKNVDAVRRAIVARVAFDLSRDDGARDNRPALRRDDLVDWPQKETVEEVGAHQEKKDKDHHDDQGKGAP